MSEQFKQHFRRATSYPYFTTRVPLSTTLLMTRATVQNLATRKRLQTSRPHSQLFFILKACLILAYVCIMIKISRGTTREYYSAFADRDQFMDAIGHFTNLRVANRLTAGRGFLNAKDIDDTERDLLRFFITDYLKFHRTNRAKGTRRLIYKPREVGNGDRFDCMLFAYWAAVLSKRVLLLDWDEPFPLSLFLESSSGAKLFLDPSEKNDSLSPSEQCKSPECALLTEKNLKYYEKVLSSETRTTFMNSHKIPLAVEESFVNQHIPENIPTIMIRSFRKSETFKRAVLHHVLRLSDSMERDHKKITKTMRLTTGIFPYMNPNRAWWKKGLDDVINRSARRYIGVHARLGKGVGEFPTERFKVVALRMKDIALCLASRAVRLAVMSGSPPLPIFLATDTAEFRIVFKKAVKNISGGGVDVLFGNWSMIHVAKVPANDMNTSGRGYGKPWESVWGGFMDLVLLGHAEHIVALYSGFPRLALSLGDAETLVEMRNEICLQNQS